MTSGRASQSNPQGCATSSVATDWPIQALLQAVGQVAPDCAVEVVRHLGSTNTELMRRARDGASSPVLLVAQQQTAGRGRLGRTWHSEATAQPATTPAKSTDAPALTFSISMPFSPQEWSGLSLAVGVSVAAALHPALGLKWPNDIWLADRKLAGILIETAAIGNSRYVVVGVGINIAPRNAAGLSTPPACLQEVLPQVDAPAALLRVAPALLLALRQFEAQGFAPFHAAFGARDVLRDRQVQLSDGACGQACGVDERGALLVHTSGGMTRVNSAEVSVRPVPAPGGNR
ncbi:MAG: biotin--[acetyl-CoA-carboxylase] ligase [Burkholderiaceae bacterium]